MLASSGRRPTIAVTGLSGYVGTRFGELFGDSVSLVDWYRRTPSPLAAASHQVDTASEDAVADALDRDRPGAVINVGAQANVDECERERGDRAGPAWRSNAQAPSVLARACERAGVRFVHVSTDYVFDGAAGPYDEASPTGHAANWYGESKLAGERGVLDAGGNAAIARIVLPYRRPPASRVDLVQLVRTRLENSQVFVGATDQLVTPTLVDDVADGLVALAESEGAGIYHLAGATILTPYEAGLAVARTFGHDERYVKPGTLAEITRQTSRAPRPPRTALLSDRFRREFGDRLYRPLKGFLEGIGTLR